MGILEENRAIAHRRDQIHGRAPSGRVFEWAGPGGGRATPARTSYLEHDTIIHGICRACGYSVDEIICGWAPRECAGSPPKGDVVMTIDQHQRKHWRLANGTRYIQGPGDMHPQRKRGLERQEEEAAERDRQRWFLSPASALDQADKLPWRDDAVVSPPSGYDAWARQRTREMQMQMQQMQARRMEQARREAAIGDWLYIPAGSYLLDDGSLRGRV